MLSSEFDLISGIPVHPLINHLVVVFVPMFALLQILIVLKPSMKQKYGWVTVAGIGIAFIASVIAKESGESLAARVGYPGEHVEAGERLTAVVAVLFATSFFWMLFTEKIKTENELIKLLSKIAGRASIFIALAALVAVYLAGHSGAKTTWENRLASKSEVAIAPNVETGITMAQVASHNSETDCWSVVDGKVYDLTKFVNQHPGGKKEIAEICGVDGTSKFKGEHGGDETPENTLSNYEIGTLAN